MFLAEATILHGWALTQQDHSDQGMVQMRDGLSAWRATGAELLTPLFFGLLADGYKKYGSIVEAYRSTAEAIAAPQRTGERVHEPELSRMNGEIRLLNAVSEPKEAEECFRQAIELAHQQGAKFWELRTGNRLALTLG